MATLTAQQIDTSGIAPSYAAADVAGDVFAHAADVFVHIKNGDASSHTASVVSQFTDSPGISAANLDITVPAGEERMFGPFNGRVFANSDGNVEITYDDVTSVTVAVLKL